METQTTFVRIFGESPIIRVLDFLVVNEDFDYSMSDIARLSGVGYATLKLFWPRLEKERIVKLVRIVGKAKMYQLNFSNSLVSEFRTFYWNICKVAVRSENSRARKILLKR